MFLVGDGVLLKPSLDVLYFPATIIIDWRVVTTSGVELNGGVSSDFYVWYFICRSVNLGYD